MRNVEKYNNKLLIRSRELRTNATQEERHLWYDFLRSFSPKFSRQKILGNYILDFYCASFRLCVELDGSQHFLDLGIANDVERTEFLNAKGVTVLRFSNLEVKNNFNGVCMEIQKTIDSLK